MGSGSARLGWRSSERLPQFGAVLQGYLDETMLGYVAFTDCLSINSTWGNHERGSKHSANVSSLFFLWRATVPMLIAPFAFFSLMSFFRGRSRMLHRFGHDNV